MKFFISYFPIGDKVRGKHNIYLDATDMDLMFSVMQYWHTPGKVLNPSLARSTCQSCTEVKINTWLTAITYLNNNPVAF